MSTNQDENNFISTLYQYINKIDLRETLGLGKDIVLTFLAQGEYNKNYILSDGVKKYVFRINYGSQINVNNQIIYEYQSLMALESSKVTPHAYYVDGSHRIFPQGILVMEYLEGKPLSYHTHMDIAASIFSSIHNVHIKEHISKNFIVEKHIFSDRIKEAEYLLTDVWGNMHFSTSCITMLERILDYAKLHEHEQKYYSTHELLCINNTEVNSHNFIIPDANGAQKGYLVDWEKAVISDPCQDITHFLAPTTTLWKTAILLSDEEREQFFLSYEHAYKAQCSLNGKTVPYLNIKERVKKYQTYLHLRAISWCAYAYGEYQKPDKAIFNKDTYHKIQEFLQEDFIRALFKEVFA